MEMVHGPDDGCRLHADSGAEAHRLAQRLFHVGGPLVVLLFPLRALDVKAHLAGIVAADSIGNGLSPTDVSRSVLNHLRPSIHLKAHPREIEQRDDAEYGDECFSEKRSMNAKNVMRKFGPVKRRVFLALSRSCSGPLLHGY